VGVNLLEIPSGAVADVWGRRESMLVSMLGFNRTALLVASAGIAFSLAGLFIHRR
jgi:hypothetical protein